jgi:hydroxymethylpyrimidine/phosphomethylpyrimidine kinase
MISPDVITAQIAAVLEDLDVRAVKIGMLFSTEIIDAVADAIAGCSAPVVLDPVMISKSGDPLMQADASAALKERLLPRAALLTPNLPEAAALLGCAPAGSLAESREQGRALMDLGAAAVLMKGGHAEGEICTDVLSAEREYCFSAPRRPTRNTHGTGCTLSSAVAAGLAAGLPLPAAVERAHAYLQGAIAAADRLRIGSGHGPVHHFYEVWK